MSQKIIEKIQIVENTDELSSLLDETFSETIVDEDVLINLLIEDIQKTIDGFSPEKNYGITPITVHIKGDSYKVSQILRNLRFAIEKLRSLQNSKNEETVKLVLRESELPEFLSDEQLMELLPYSKSTISTKRSRGKLPQTNDLGFTATSDLFKMLRDSTPGYLSAAEKVQQKMNNRRKR